MLSFKKEIVDLIFFANIYFHTFFFHLKLGHINTVMGPSLKSTAILIRLRRKRCILYVSVGYEL